LIACQLLLHVGYRLVKPFAPGAPSESLLAERESALLHPIQFIEPVHMGNYFPDLTIEAAVRQHRAPKLIRQARSGLRHRGYGHPSEDVVQEFQLESPAYRFRNDPDARAGKERRDIGHESMKVRRSTTRSQRRKKFSGNISNDVQFNLVVLEDWIRDLDETSEVFLLHHPLE